MSGSPPNWPSGGRSPGDGARAAKGEGSVEKAVQALDGMILSFAAATAMDTELLMRAAALRLLHCSGRLRSRLTPTAGAEEARVIEQVELYGVFLLLLLAAHALFAHAGLRLHIASRQDRILTCFLWFGTAHCLTLRCTLPCRRIFCRHQPFQ